MGRGWGEEGAETWLVCTYPRARVGCAVLVLCASRKRKRKVVGRRNGWKGNTISLPLGLFRLPFLGRWDSLAPVSFLPRYLAIFETTAATATECAAYVYKGEIGERERMGEMNENPFLPFSHRRRRRRGGYMSL